MDNFICRLFPGRTWAGMIRLARAKGSNIVDAGVKSTESLTILQRLSDVVDEELIALYWSIAMCSNYSPFFLLVSNLGLRSLQSAQSITYRIWKSRGQSVDPPSVDEARPRITVEL